ncbi:hypothetical protein [Paraburkholderia caribensis]|uniref:hypothetical protein n=1 Tax=Paraburkholderia caribensis TaxID=75105 RepID=UPI0007214C28|nr:hypothetical protein [Paraburkholderia caribensis]ALP61361.1 hypothetical protein AN416_01320 [Paraburkholderia caribensis]AUT50513.1 hypothetical protein C2L66_00705 [Paraburkholderia caribensis]
MEAISKGLNSHSETPVAWLKSFVDDLSDGEGLNVVADRSEMPQELALLEKPPVVIVVDCGTGETKLLLYTVQAENVSFKQLVKLGPASSYVDDPKEFVGTIQKQFDLHKADMVLVAASAWMRDASTELVERGNDLLQQLTDAVVIWKTLSPREEAWLELAAAKYACEKLGVSIGAVWAAGGGSTQMTECSTADPKIHPYSIGNQTGLSLLKSQGTQEGLRQWRQQVRRFHQGSSVELSGRILGISAVSHAAKACGLAIREPLPREEVLHSFDAFIERRSAMEHLSENDLLDLANVAQQRETLDLVVAPDATLYFVREIGDEDARIRITWSLGWYLELLAILDQFPVPRDTLLRLWAEKAELEKIGSNFRVGEGTPVAATGQVLRDLESGTKALRDRARHLEGQVTSLLRDVAKVHHARLEGENHRLKTGESLERKLKERLRRLLERHRSHRLYYPRLADVFHEVDDALRYTMVVCAKDYAQTTEAVLRTLEERLLCTHVRFNYWAEGSTYRGVNAFIKWNSFTFELQFHTPESWQLKQEASHEIYESFRELPPGRAKLVLYEHMKGLWNDVPMPPGIEAITAPAPMRDPMMELLSQQLSQLLALRKRYAASAMSILDGSAFSSPEERHTALAGLGCRLIRGVDPSHFETLAYPPDQKRLAWISNLSEIEPVKDLRDAVMSLMGKPAAWVDKKLAEEHTWKLVIMPTQVCQLATWDGLFESIRSAYPEVARKVQKFSAALRGTPFKEIQAQISPPCTFRSVKDAKDSHPQYIDLQRLVDIAQPTLWQVRCFLYIVIGVNEQFRGDGFTYDDLGVRHGREYLLPNTAITKIPGCEVFELKSTNWPDAISEPGPAGAYLAGST